MSIKYFGRGPTQEPDATEGIASVTLTLKEPPEKMIPINGCVVRNNQDLKNLLNDYQYIKRFKNIKYFVYFYCSQQDLRTRLDKAEISVYRFTKPTKDKLCILTVDEVKNAIYPNDEVRKVGIHGPETVSGNHKFVPCKSFNNSNEFLENYSLGIPEAVPIELTCDGSYKGLAIKKKDSRVQFVSFNASSDNNSLQLVLNDDTVFNTLVDGPLLLDKKVAGWYIKATDNNIITVYKFGTQGSEVPPTKVPPTKEQKEPNTETEVDSPEQSSSKGQKEADAGIPKKTKEPSDLDGDTERTSNAQRLSSRQSSGSSNKEDYEERQELYEKNVEADHETEAINIVKDNGNTRRCPLGLTNTSNNCWFNSLLQAVLHTRIGHWIIEQCDQNNGSETYRGQLGALLRRLRNGRGPVMNPAEVLTLFHSINPTLAVGGQHDVFEALGLLLESVDAAENDGKEDGHGPDCALVNYTYSCQQCRQIIDDIQQWQHFSISLAVSAASSLQECLDNNSRINPGTVERSCTTCGKTTVNDHWDTIIKTPDVLVIHLKRFDNSGGKLDTAITVPIDLNISSMLMTEGDALYTLQSVVEHLGTSPKSGHYQSIVQVQKQWFSIDDRQFNTVDTPTDCKTNGYLFFYEKSQDAQERGACGSDIMVDGRKKTSRDGHYKGPGKGKKIHGQASHGSTEQGPNRDNRDNIGNPHKKNEATGHEEEDSYSEGTQDQQSSGSSNKEDEKQELIRIYRTNYELQEELKRKQKELEDKDKEMQYLKELLNEKDKSLKRQETIQKLEEKEISRLEQVAEEKDKEIRALKKDKSLLEVERMEETVKQLILEIIRITFKLKALEEQVKVLTVKELSPKQETDWQKEFKDKAEQLLNLIQELFKTVGEFKAKLDKLDSEDGASIPDEVH